MVAVRYILPIGALCLLHTVMPAAGADFVATTAKAKTQEEGRQLILNALPADLQEEARKKLSNEVARDEKHRVLNPLILLLPSPLDEIVNQAYSFLLFGLLITLSNAGLGDIADLIYGILEFLYLLPLPLDELPPEDLPDFDGLSTTAPGTRGRARKLQSDEDKGALISLLPIEPLASLGLWVYFVLINALIDGLVHIGIPPQIVFGVLSALGIPFDELPSEDELSDQLDEIFEGAGDVSTTAPDELSTTAPGGRN